MTIHDTPASLRNELYDCEERMGSLLSKMRMIQKENEKLIVENICLHAELDALKNPENTEAQYFLLGDVLEPIYSSLGIILPPETIESMNRFGWWKGAPA